MKMGSSSTKPSNNGTALSISTANSKTKQAQKSAYAEDNNLVMTSNTNKKSVDCSSKHQNNSAHPEGEYDDDVSNDAIDDYGEEGESQHS